MSAAPPEAGRLASLDAFRGFAIAGMVLVNNPGDWGHLHAPLAHAEWNGWTFTDLIFPFFLFISGVSMALSLGRRAQAGEDKVALVRGMARRAAVIFAVGLALNFMPSFDPATVRIPGVLQRIALCVLAAAPIVVCFGTPGIVAAIVSLLAAYSVPMLLVPVPDANGAVAAGILEPGRDFGAFVDRHLLAGHLWSKSRTWDPEGLVSTLPACASLLFGVLAGEWLKSRRSGAAHANGLALAGIACLAAGLALEAVLMPINKNLWTPSYCIFTTGWSLLAFAAFFAVMDAAASAALRQASRRALLPLTIYGMNALFLFAFSGFVARLLVTIEVGGTPGNAALLKSWLFAPIQALPLSPENASLAFAIAFNAALFGVAWLMWKQRWFVKA
jgi:predicted acyltransferase